ncbi:NAD-dependent epimerase/dehydratase family protein [Anseongella ginsenosidimutans]|nr:NAD(P)-dependent oxidoreductase [Anseongella ginsenosidimutans]QEC52202.1 NAD(P)-dependent oxidoreductase [Anseongella ginsenosidimutans]
MNTDRKMKLEEVNEKVAAALEPSRSLIAGLEALDGDILILGAGGKIGPSIARLAKQALLRAGSSKRVIAVSRFSEPGLKEQLQQEGIETRAADLLDERQLQALPEAENILYLAGNKFGTTGQEAFTWAMNTYLPGRIAEKYRSSRIVVYSTGNVYPFMPSGSGGAAEDQAPEPVGEYGQSCLGRERIFQYFSSRYNTPLLIYRLNYAIDLRYGVLTEIARAIMEQRPVDLGTGHVNVIWQGDANEMALRALGHCSVPPRILNITGPETIPVRWLATELGKLLGRQPEFVNTEQPTALLSNAGAAHRLFGYPKVTLTEMVEWTAAWVREGGELLNKPTHFQERKGRF